MSSIQDWRGGFRPARSAGIFVFTLLAAVLIAGCASAPPAPKHRSAPAAHQPLSGPQQSVLENARLAAAQDNWTRAAELLRPLHEQRPDSALVASRLGWVMQQQGDTASARVLYQKAVEQDPTEALAVNNLALLMREEGRFRAARDLLQAAIDRGADDPRLHYNLAVLSEIYLLDYPAALRHYRRYRQLAGAESEAVAGWIRDLERRAD
ncbi:tetratricopeptide repeat protein [Marinobacter profundi]|nr:tetratricopeptide repeat protein [Marinobacter profundi]